MDTEQIHNRESFVEKIKTFVFSYKKQIYVFGVLVPVLVCAVLYYVFIATPANFPLGTIVRVEKGETVKSFATDLSNKDIIKSPFVFRVLAFIAGRGIIAGDYLMKERENTLVLAYRFMRGVFYIEQIKITIPEGLSTVQIADILAKKLPRFDVKQFLKETKDKEGYLFPETYIVPQTIQTTEMIQLMRDMFDRKIKEVPEIARFNKPLSDIVTMASLVEEEARTTESRRIIAGILWKRLALGMPLQVDVTFARINGKNSSSLTIDDLKIDSPYNTYRYKGLPPTPIVNPGLDAIRSTVTPIQTPYVYFLASKDGKIYYAKTFEEHKRNKELYLR